MSEWWIGMELMPQASLPREKLAEMTTEEVFDYFKPYLMAPRQTETILPFERARHVHLFPSLHARRPACRRRIPFEPMDCSFSRERVTCPGCLEASQDGRAA